MHRDAVYLKLQWGGKGDHWEIMWQSILKNTEVVLRCLLRLINRTPPHVSFLLLSGCCIPYLPHCWHSLTSRILSPFHYFISNSTTPDTEQGPGERQDRWLPPQCLRFSCHRQVVEWGHGRDIARLKQAENAVTCAIFNLKHSYLDRSQVGVLFLQTTACLGALLVYIILCKYRLVRAFACRLHRWGAWNEKPFGF